MAFRRRQFQQNRSKSAIEIATDFLLQTRLQDSTKSSTPDGSRVAGPGSQKVVASPRQQHCHRSSTSPVSLSNQSDPSPIEVTTPGGSTGAGDADSKGNSMVRESSDAFASSVDYTTAGPVRSNGATPPSPTTSPLSSPSATSALANGVGETKAQQQQQQLQHLEESEHQDRKSWRKAIFDRVCTTVVPGTTLLYSGNEHSSSNIRRKKKSAEVRARWKKATLETLLVLRLKKDSSNCSGEEEEEGGVGAEHRLGYAELSPCGQEARDIWEGLLRSSSTGCPPSLPYRILLGHVKKGIPRELRGVVWKFLALQQSSQSGAENCSSDMYEVPYSDLLDRFSADQHAILIDLGRTFPGHPFFAKSLGPGQVSLFNLLKAYSLLDEEVGYCQGVSFIAGVLLMHMEEASAFEMIRHLMLGLGLRTVYCPSMAALQMKLYQMVRLLHDHDSEVWRRLEQHEVVPALYATPWFLTLFASQFPLCFVARVFDLLFIQGPDVIFKVALTLLTCHRELILQIDNFEELVDFLKTGLPEMARIQAERVTGQAVHLDIAQDLHNYEIEFLVLRDEMLSSSHSASSGDITTTTTTSGAGIHKTNNTHNNNNNIIISGTQSNVLALQHAIVRLQEEKRELAEQLARVHSQAHTLHMAANRFRLNEDKFKARIRALELERAALLGTVSRLQTDGAGAAQEEYD
ncbi:TBC1 domain family member 1-like [Babylonia areolata]|uniref:TBC1 domain family member 1-like n=1 Tax=Babylonia areolata TaxID=304850 RepID=UPI003FD6B296